VSDHPVVILAGGTGGAKLARGMLDLVGPRRLVVIANTGDDIDIYGASVSPDPDLVSFSLAGVIDQRGWGIAGDTFSVMDALRHLGRDVWFNLGDRDLAWCLERTRMIAEGLRPTEALSRLCAAIGLTTAVLPMADVPLRTHVDGLPFQEFMILRRGQGPVQHVSFHGDVPGQPPPEVRDALARAGCVILGPSNPVISIWPILNALGATLRAVQAPVVCVSPIVGGQIVKGPTAAFLDAYGHSLDAPGVLAFYETVAPGLIDGIVSDEALHPSQLPRSMPSLCIDTLMGNADRRVAVARRALRFAESLRAHVDRTRVP
jgi:LPPG:FO 2-phospho-L-lactate transferase